MIRKPDRRLQTTAIVCFFLIYLTGCSEKKEKPLSFDRLLDRSLKTQEVLHFSHEAETYYFSVLAQPAPQKYFGVGFTERVTATGSKIVKPVEILFLTDERRLYKQKEYGPVMCLMTSLPQLSLVQDEYWTKNVAKVAGDVQERAQRVFDLYVSNRSMELNFIEDYSITGISVSVSARSMASLISGTTNSVNEFPFQKYSEYQVRKVETPVVTAVDEERLSFPDVYTRTRVTSVRLDSGQGLFTNRFVWGANNGYFEDYELNISLRNEYNLCMFKLINSSEKVEDVPLIALSYLETIRECSDPVMEKREQRLVAKLKDIRDRLDAAWQKRELNAVYIRFKERPPFIGYLEEYIPGYSYDEIIHAVVSERNGDYIILTDPLQIEEIEVQTAVDVRKWTELVGVVQRRRQLEYPVNPVLHFSNQSPLIYTGQNSWSKGCKITLSKMFQLKKVHIPNSAKPRLVLEPPDASSSLLLIEGFLELPATVDNAVDLQHDEFRVYDRNGDFYQMKCFIALDGIDSVCSIQKLTGAFKLIVAVPNREPVFFFQFRDSPPIPVVLTESIPAEYGNPDKQ
ncbi:MAG: hypothetical protein C4541_13560 [Candidatus Auribacter fodinae]|jgi:hypothetical protein|uniref:Uncharacterized protein n=1 Tax=Candidatus Auribacter fodinae TaxID=2093366 RepID=A0A3A4QPL2_9BACT|nr:MAG: hypothetical protein C4541_13560 [Candidatus Auribacter fodinae]